MSATWFLLGGAAWNAAEYAIHRFVGHGPKLRRSAHLIARLTPAGLAAEFNAEHLAHHTDPSYFAASSKKALAAAAGIPAIFAATAPLFGARRSLAFALGFSVMYGGYEVLHRRIHTHPPRGPYGRWVRRHHLLHHHKTPRNNHGVTTPLFDHLVGTFLPLERVRVPRHAAPPWLADPLTGEVRSELAHDYELVGRARAAEPKPSPPQAPVTEASS